MTVAVLFARSDSHYKAVPGCDVWDAERDALKWPGGSRVIAHPPCRGWGRLRHFAKPLPGELDLARYAVRQVRRYGGVLEHPVATLLWPDQRLPAPGQRDNFGGWTLPVWQSWFGHRADKATLLYIVGCEPADIPPFPLRLGTASHVIAQRRTLANGSRLRKGMPGWRPEVTRAERELTPPPFAAWLVDLASRCRVSA